MQKLNLKKRFAKTLLAVMLLMLLAGTFFAMAGEVRAGDEFEVSLQTPFAEPPDPSTCTIQDFDDYKTKDGYLWACYAKSEKWVQIIHGKDGGEILQSYAALLYKWLAGFVGIVSVLILIIGGIQIITAGANQEGLQSGKDRIIAALVGLALLFLSSLILYTINPTFFI